MPDYAKLLAEWDEVLARRGSLREPLGFWTAILQGWAGWKPPMLLQPLRWSAEDCCARWERGVPLGAEAEPVIAPDAVEDLLGPVMERLAADGPEAAEAFQRFAEAWDRGEIGPSALWPRPDRDPAAFLQERFKLASHLGAFLGPAALRPALETYFEGTRGLPEGLWSRGICPWCGGAPGYGDLIEDGRRRLSCHLCGGTWIAARLKCPFCDTWDSKDLVRLIAEGIEEGYFIEACRVCRGYLKGVDRRQRWNAGSPLVEDWSSPHLDLHAMREGYWRATPTLVHLLPPDAEG
jgi:hypothetical protein